MAQKPSIAKGTRDFSPIEMAKRNYIFNTIKEVFLLYGFQQIETPAMENLSTLMGKYGEEGDKLLFKILNSGDYLKSAPDELLENRDYIHLITKISEKGLRYDLTVPFARYVVMHRNEIQFPFKRYQIQPVWRADRPQKGRYREFYQCDADVVGSDSLMNEVELISMIDEVFHRFGVNITIKVNNRKVLSDNVNAELLEKGLPQSAVDALQPLLSLSGSNEEKLDSLASLLQNSEVGMKGVEELRYVLSQAQAQQPKACIELDVSLARGLNYYTGTILEVKAQDVVIGSITGGGRYDNLTGVFGMPGTSGVGISFGADRIYDVLNALDLYPKDTLASTKVLFINFGDKESEVALKYVMQLRKEGIPAEIYPDATKMKKQMTYANNKNVEYVAMVGETEIANGTIALKCMESGEQENLTIHQVIQKIQG